MAIDRLAQLAVDIVVNTRRAKSQLLSFQKTMGRSSTAISKAAAGIGVVGLAASAVLLVRKAFIGLSEAISASVTAYAEFEQKLINVAKIAKLDDLNQLADVFKRLGQAIPSASFSDISATMSEASRAGIRGADSLEKFTASALRFAAVSDDISGREAARGMARLLGNFGLDPGENAENLGASIDALSDKFETTSGEILKTSQRLAGFAKATNLSLENLNAFSAALLRSGATPTTIRTTISKLLTVMTSFPIKTARAVRLSEDELKRFATAIRTEPLEAIKMFSAALSKMTPKEQTLALTDLGLASSRVAAVIKVLQISTSQLAEAQEISNNAMLRGTGLLEKHFVKAQEAAGQIKALGKEWTLLKASFIESRVVIDTLAGSLDTLADALERIGIASAEFNIEKAPLTPEDTLRKMKEIRKEIDASLNNATSGANAIVDSLGAGIPAILRMLKSLGEVKRLERIHASLAEIHVAQIKGRAAVRAKEKEDAKLKPDVPFEPERDFAQERKDLMSIANVTGPFEKLIRLFETTVKNKLAAGDDKELITALDSLFRAQFEALGSSQNKPGQFRGLTQAWKNAVISVDKNGPQLKVAKEQKKLAERILVRLGLNGKAITKKLQQILDKEEDKLK